MKKLTEYLIALFLLGYMVSCTSKADQAKINAIDTLLMSLNDAEEMLLSVDNQTVDKKLQLVKENTKFIQDNLTDTIDKATALEISEYYSYRKALTFYKENYGEFQEAINTSRKQLNDLKADVENGLLTDEKFNEYYNNEMRIALEITQNIEQAVNGVNIVLPKIDQKQPVIEKVIEHIRQKNQD